MEYRKQVNRLYLIGSFIIFGLAFVFHFLYKWSNFNSFVGAFAATNESIFQHIKMVFYCVVIYYFITYFIFANKYKIDIRKYMLSILVTFFVTSIIVIGTYYTLQYGFNVESGIINILSLLVGLIISNLINIHIYKRVRVLNFHSNLSLILIFIISIGVTYLHFNPVEVDFFYDNEHKTYENVLE